MRELLALTAVAVMCLAPAGAAEPCRADCAVGKQTVVRLSGVDAAAIGRMVVRDSSGRFAAISNNFQQLLIFDAAGKLLRSPRPTYERIVSLFIGSAGSVQAYDLGSASLLTFDANYRVTSKLELPQYPALPLSGARFLVARQIDKPGLVGQPLHVMSRDGSILRSFGGDKGPFRSDEVFKNTRHVCLNADGTIWSIASGGRLLERWDISTGRRLAEVKVQSTWFRESAKAAPGDQVSNPLVLAIWPDKDLIWILSQAPDPHWVPRRIPEKELIGNTELTDRRFDWVLEAVRTDTGGVVATKTFDRALRRWVGSFAILSDASSAGRAGGVELWNPIVVTKGGKQ